jgi:hypothetical protein
MEPATTSLRDETRRLLAERPRNKTIEHIAHAASVPVKWLNEFSRGTYGKPDVSRVQSVYETLTGRKLI